MELINESYVKKLMNDGDISPKGSITVEENQVFTPSAIEYLNEKNIKIVKKDKSDINNTTKTFNTVFGGIMTNKPEHMTHLYGNTLVFKDHPIIEYRGCIDYLESEIISLQIITEKDGYTQITKDLEEIIELVRRLIRVQITKEALGEYTLQGLDARQLREHSHHSTKHYGISHFLPSYKHGVIVAGLNRLRTITRKTELVAYKAFKDAYGNTERDDIIEALNRLSSIFWIMMCKFIAGLYKTDR